MVKHNCRVRRSLGIPVMAYRCFIKTYGAKDYMSVIKSLPIEEPTRGAKLYVYYRCTGCDSCFASKGECEAHLDEEEVEEPMKPPKAEDVYGETLAPKYVCSCCGATFPTSSRCWDHIKESHDPYGETCTCKPYDDGDNDKEPPECECSDWVDVGCIGDSGYMEQTRTCDPPDCKPERREVSDPKCKEDGDEKPPFELGTILLIAGVIVGLYLLYLFFRG